MNVPSFHFPLERASHPLIPNALLACILSDIHKSSFFSFGQCNLLNFLHPLALNEFIAMESS